MTNTEVSNQTARREWISQIVEGVSPSTPPVVWRAVLHLMMAEAPLLASPLNRWWSRRIRWMRLASARGEDPRVIVIQTLSDMKFANDNNGR